MKTFKSLRFAFVSFEACLLSSPSSFASTSNWSDRDSWSESSKRIPYTESHTYSVSPFSPGSNNLAIDVGQVFLMGDLGKYNDAIGTQLHYTYGVSDLFAFDSSFGYSSHSDGKFSMTTLLTGLRTNLSWYDKVVPYLVFGLGFYRPNYEIPLGPSPQSPNASVAPMLFGVHIGPGVDLELTRQIFFGAALTFHDAFGSKQTIPGTPSTMDAGGTYTSFFVHTGYTF